MSDVMFATIIILLLMAYYQLMLIKKFHDIEDSLSRHADILIQILNEIRKNEDANSN